MNRCTYWITLILIAVVGVCVGQAPQAIADKIEQMTPNDLALRANQEFLPTRSPLLDSLFNIPIQTLRAVNDLVQSIAGNLQTAGAPPRRPERIPKQRHPDRYGRDIEDED